MATLRLSTLAAIVIAFVGSMLAMNNADIIKMKKADFSDETIMASIAKEAGDYDTSTDALIELKKAGISEAVIQKMMAAKKGGATSAAMPGAAPAAEASAGFANQDFPSIAPTLVTPVAGKDYFLRFTLHCEKGHYVGTNYARGEVVPINTPVKVVSMKGEIMMLKRSDNGTDLKIENIEKYTKKSLAEFARILLAEEKTPLEKLPADLASSITNGDMRKGMTKEQVLMARGYPPLHETTSIESDHWIYWSSTFVKQTIVFNNGRLTEGRGIF